MMHTSWLMLMNISRYCVDVVAPLVAFTTQELSEITIIFVRIGGFSAVPEKQLISEQTSSTNEEQLLVRAIT